MVVLVVGSVGAALVASLLSAALAPEVVVLTVTVVEALLILDETPMELSDGYSSVRRAQTTGVCHALHYCGPLCKMIYCQRRTRPHCRDPPA